VTCRAIAEDPDNDCESEEEILKYASEVTIDLFLKNKYFDSREFNEYPVKDYV